MGALFRRGSASRVVVSLAALLGPPCAGTAAPVDPLHVTLELPGPPVDLIPVDLDGRGGTDLVVVLVYNEYDEIEFEQASGFVQVTEIVPALFERREARAYLRWKWNRGSTCGRGSSPRSSTSTPMAARTWFSDTGRG